MTVIRFVEGGGKMGGGGVNEWKGECAQFELVYIYVYKQYFV